MLHFQTAKKLTPLSLFDLIEQGGKLSNAQITKINQLFLDLGSQTIRSPPISHVYLNRLGRDMVDMISYVLGYNSTECVDETVLVLMAMFSPGKPPSVCYDYAAYIANKMHEQLMNFDRERVFIYTSYIYHLLLFNQHDHFPFQVKRFDAQGNQRSVVFWSSAFHHAAFSPYNYCEFIDLFIHPAMTLLLSSPPPRLTDEMQRILQLSKAYSIGDWYFYQNHTVIRIYGCELAPYRLQRYVPMRLFALEYFRQFGNADIVHFHSKNKKAQLKVKNQLGPFIYNKREEAWQEADKMLASLRLQTSFLWVPYDPNHFISLRRIRYKLHSYNHLRLTHVEKYANQSEWKEGTIEEAMTKEELAQRAFRNLENLADLEHCTQVFPLPSTQVGAAASSSTTPQKAGQTSTQAAGSDKGKQIQQEQPLPVEQQEEQPQQQEEMAKAPAPTEQQAQESKPQAQKIAVETSVLQTPINEERSRKIDREEDTPPTTLASQQGEKRQRLNPFSEEEMPIGPSMGMGP